MKLSLNSIKFLIVLSFCLYPYLSFAVKLNEAVRVSSEGLSSVDGVVTKIEGEKITVHYKSKSGRFKSVTVPASSARAAKHSEQAYRNEEERLEVDSHSIAEWGKKSMDLRSKYGLGFEKIINPDGSAVPPKRYNNVQMELQAHLQYIKDLEKYKLSSNEKKYWQEYYQHIITDLKLQADRKGIDVSNAISVQPERKPSSESRPAQTVSPEKQKQYPLYEKGRAVLAGRAVSETQSEQSRIQDYLQMHGLFTTKKEMIPFTNDFKQSPVGTYVFRKSDSNPDAFVMNYKSDSDPVLMPVTFKVVGSQIVKLDSNWKEIPGSKTSFDQFLKNEIPEGARSFGQYHASQKLLEQGLYVPYENRKEYESQPKLYSGSYYFSPHPKLPGILLLHKVGESKSHIAAFAAQPDGSFREVTLGSDNGKVVIEEVFDTLTLDEMKKRYLSGVSEENYIAGRVAAILEGNFPCVKRALSSERKKVQDLKQVLEVTPPAESEIEAQLKKVFTYHDPSKEFYPRKGGEAYKKILEDSKNVEKVVYEMVANYLHLYITGQITAETEPKPHRPMLDRIMTALPREMRAVGKDQIEQIAFKSYVYHGLQGLYAHRNLRDNLKGKDAEAAIELSSPEMKEFRNMMYGAIGKDFVGGKARPNDEIDAEIAKYARRIQLEREKVYLELQLENQAREEKRPSDDDSYNRRAEKLENMNRNKKLFDTR